MNKPVPQSEVKGEGPHRGVMLGCELQVGWRVALIASEVDYASARELTPRAEGFRNSRPSGYYYPFAVPAFLMGTGCNSGMKSNCALCATAWRYPWVRTE